MWEGSARFPYGLSHLPSQTIPLLSGSLTKRDSSFALSLSHHTFPLAAPVANFAKFILSTAFEYSPDEQLFMSSELRDAFLCHNKADKDWVRKLGAHIEQQTIDGLPTSRHLTVFFDEWDIDYGENVINRMNQGLASARNVIVVMSPEFFESGWTNFEWTDVVSEDPWGTKKKLVPILLRDVSKDGGKRIVLPAPFKALRYFDFRESRSFEREFINLLRRIRGLPPSRGLSTSAAASAIPIRIAENLDDSWAADNVRDVVLGNLLEVRSFPAKIWSAATTKNSSEEVWAEAPEAEAHIIRNKRVWTLAGLQLQSCELRKVIDTATILGTSSRDWIVDEEKIHWWITLLNKALKKHLSKLAIKREDGGRFFFRPNIDGSDRVWQNGDDPERTVAAKKINPLDGSVFWVHHAARIRFKRIGDRFFLMIEPTYLFTSDGNQPLAGQEMGKMVIMWSGRQRNDSILRNFLFWAKTIARSERLIEIQSGGEPIVISAVPALSVAPQGIASDHIRIGSLMKTVDKDLEEAAKDVEIVSADAMDELNEPTDE